MGPARIEEPLKEVAVDLFLLEAAVKVHHPSQIGSAAGESQDTGSVKAIERSTRLPAELFEGSSRRGFK